MDDEINIAETVVSNALIPPRFQYNHAHSYSSKTIDQSEQPSLASLLRKPGCVTCDGTRGLIFLTFAKLEQSSEGGCGLCELLHAIMTAVLSDNFHLEKEGLERTYSMNPANIFNILEWGEMSKTWRLTPFKPLDIFTPCDSRLYFDVSHNGIPTGNTSSETAFSRFKSWLSHCVTSHSCHVAADGLSPLPNRVLDLEAVDNISGIKLCETSNELASYVCLSHCWGTKPPPVITTRDTFSANKIEICLDVLPRTFRDTVHFVRKMGIRYLWIDTQCIIQGDKHDWEIESSQMAQVYRNSYLTICATASPDCDGGLFGISTPQHRKISSPALTAVCGDLDLYTRPAIRHIGPLGSTDGFGDPATEPLSTRAWAYQERLLAPRVLHFTKDELFWECCEMAACECKFARKESKRYGGTIPFPKMHHRAATQHIASSDHEDLDLRWHDVVSEYSGLQLTKDDDKLPALSGIARQMQEIRKDKYYAGLWERTLVTDLLWFVEKPGSRPTQWRAPTWSWASIDSPVKYFDAREQFDDWIEASVRCEPEGLDPTRRVKPGAALTLVADIITGKLKYQGDRDKYSIDTGANTFKDGIFEDFPLINDRSLGFREKVEGLNYETEDCANFLISGPVFLLSLNTDKRAPRLVLKRISPNENVFERIGFCWWTEPFSTAEILPQQTVTII